MYTALKKAAIAFLLINFVSASFAQPVFTYGKYAVSKEEFLTAFNKNPGNTSNRKKALKEYLNLYINFRLKVQAALDAGLHKDQTQQNELDNFSKQIADNIVNQQAHVNDLVKEAFERSRKDINLGHVLIEVAENSDTAEAYKKIQEAYKALKEGQEFSKVAAAYSTDAGIKASGGNLGFITAFTLAYEFENIAYRLNPNAVSAPYRSKLGYHIFKNLGERDALGTRTIAQILIAFPPNANEVEKKDALRRADSVSNFIENGNSFEELATKISNDLTSSANGGQIADVGINTYDPVFEQVVFSLKNNGDISKPFETSSGYHIVKLIEAKKVTGDLNNTETNTYLKNKVTKDSRMNEAKRSFFTKQLKIIKYKPAIINEKLLYEFSDSAVVKPSPVSYKGISENTLLFSFAKQNIKAGEWVKFIRAARGLPENAGKKLNELYNEFLRMRADNYYRNNLEDYSGDFKKQLKEFKEANILFAIMEKKVWGKANADTAGLRKYYNEHKTKYTWGASADALIITCTNEAEANKLQEKLTNNLSKWREITANNTTEVTADTGRYELGQLSVFERTNFTAGSMTLPVKNTTDGTATFNYIIRVYKDPELKSFEDARGMVISDYQQLLEDKWIAELKNKYPVKVNTAVFSSIN
jgi:peptidyl-prolyl cis-trans isomerase SurA